MEWHLDQALQARATDEEEYETIDVAIEMGRGQAGAYTGFELKALEYFQKQQKIIITSSLLKSKADTFKEHATARHLLPSEHKGVILIQKKCPRNLLS